MELDTWAPRSMRCTRRAGRRAGRSKRSRARRPSRTRRGSRARFETPAGAIVRTVKPGTGAMPQPTEGSKVHYMGKLLDGTEFDSSRKRDQPVGVPAQRRDQVLGRRGGAHEGRRAGGAHCPADTAYGDGAASATSRRARRWCSTSSWSGSRSRRPRAAATSRDGPAVGSTHGAAPRGTRSGSTSVARDQQRDVVVAARARTRRPRPGSRRAPRRAARRRAPR